MIRARGSPWYRHLRPHLVALWLCWSLSAAAVPPVVSEPGKGPAPRTYSFTANSKTGLRLVLAQTATEQVKSARTETILPEVTVDLDLTITSVAGGVASFEARLSRIKVAPQKGTEPGAAAALQKGFDDGPPLRLSGTVGPHGDTSTRLADGLTPSSSTAEIVQMVLETVRGLWPPLPEAPVGIGGVWRRDGERSQDGMRYATTVSVTLHAPPGSGLSFEWKRTETMAEGAPVPDAPPGMKARFQTASTTTTGTIALRPDGLPVAGEVRGTGTLEMAGESNGKPFSLTLGEKRTVRIETR